MGLRVDDDSVDVEHRDDNHVRIDNNASNDLDHHDAEADADVDVDAAAVAVLSSVVASSSVAFFVVPAVLSAALHRRTT